MPLALQNVRKFVPVLLLLLVALSARAAAGPGAPHGHSALALAACLLGAWALLRAGRDGPRVSRRAWRFLAYGLLCWGAGQVAYTAFLLAGWPGLAPLAGAVSLGLPVLFGLGLLQFPRPARSGLPLAGYVLDMLTLGTIFCSLAWFTLLKGAPGLYGQDTFALGLALADPLADLLLCAALLVMLLWRPRDLSRLQLLCLLAGLVFFLAADLGRALDASRVASGEGAVALWTWGLACFGSAASLGALRLPGLPLPPLGKHAARLARLLRPLVIPALVLAAYLAFYFSQEQWPLEAGQGRAMFTVAVLMILRQIVALLDVQQANARLARITDYDALTGLAGRAALEGLLNSAIQDAERQRRLVGVLFLDLDRMKHVNDWYGHQQGDKVLREMARRLGQLAREGDVVARFDGDAFVVVLRRVERAEDAARVAERLRDSVAQPVNVGGDALYITASVGIALCPLNAGEAELALHNAYTAMYQAKQGGRNGVRFFDDQQQSGAVHDGQLERNLRWALQNNELRLHYQPLVRLTDERVVGFEALLRWSSPVLGDVPPYEAIRVAEQRGLIVPLGLWALEQAARQVKIWRSTIHEDVYISVNVSALQFKQGDFVAEVQRVLWRHDLPGEALLLELTETNLVGDVMDSARRIEALGELGVRVALDDFGTGYSSLSSLRDLPVDVLKIDRSFLRSLDERGSAFLQAIIGLAQSIGLTLVVEGIETAEQHDLLLRLGCDLGQGFFFAPPLPASDIDERYELPVDLVQEGPLLDP